MSFFLSNCSKNSEPSNLYMEYNHNYMTGQDLKMRKPHLILPCSAIKNQNGQLMKNLDNYLAIDIIKPLSHVCSCTFTGAKMGSGKKFSSVMDMIIPCLQHNIYISYVPNVYIKEYYM